jgi:phage major head subunit gpT-like protein
MSLLEIGRQLIEKEGVSTRGMDKLQLAQRALSTSDFPAVLANVANKTLRAGYEAAPQTFKPFTKQTSAPDFKTIQRTQLGDAPQLKKVNEAGEFTYGAISDGKETYSLATYGRIIAVTRQTLINDDLAAFADLPAKFGRAAANLESDIVWGIITTNAALADGVALFHATHGNLGSGVIAVAGLNAMRGAMRIQKSLDGQFINVMPSYLIVPAALETTAQQYTSADFVSAKSSDINPFKSALQVLVEPRLDASSTSVWYAAADPMTIDTIEYCYLDGNEGVYIETRNGFEVDGMEIKARLDFAAKAIDFRGLYKSTGV